MSQDVLYLLEPGFTDPKYPGEKFVCPHCVSIEGLLASVPNAGRHLKVVHVPFQRPREVVIQALDADHQGLPVLLLSDELPVPHDAQDLGDKHFITDSKRILELLAERHGYPKLH